MMIRFPIERKRDFEMYILSFYSIQIIFIASFTINNFQILIVLNVKEYESIWSFLYDWTKYALRKI